MAFVTGNYQGLTVEEYNQLVDVPAFADFISYFELLNAGNGQIYVFSGNEDDFNNMLVDEDLEADIDLEWYTYILSTNSISGFPFS